MAGDFETLCRYPEANAPAFVDSYDITGRGLESPYQTNAMGYAAERSLTLEKVLGVPLPVALQGVQEKLKEELREASLSFKTHKKRHGCRAQRIYSSFSVRGLTISKDEAQRDVPRRLERFGVTRESITGRSVLDLGSNVGGMLFELQKFEPSRSLGVEYDGEKVAISRKIARYAGLANVGILQADIDKLKPEDIKGRHDVVFCLAINRHVLDPERLFWLLGETTAHCLYFEGNSGTDVDQVARNLSAQGFSKVEQLGLNDDDCLPENNVRPILTAYR
jgi:SAM-dependent methyltransferase